MGWYPSTVYIHAGFFDKNSRAFGEGFADGLLKHSREMNEKRVAGIRFKGLGFGGLGLDGFWVRFFGSEN